MVNLENPDEVGNQNFPLNVEVPIKSLKVLDLNQCIQIEKSHFMVSNKLLELGMTELFEEDLMCRQSFSRKI